MKVHLIRKDTIEVYAIAHARGRPSFEEWLEKLKQADWLIPSDIKETFGTADLLGKSSSRVVFDIGGNTYRVICKYGFGARQVHLFICWIGTHTEYDQINARNEQYTVNNY